MHKTEKESEPSKIEETAVLDQVSANYTIFVDQLKDPEAQPVLRYLKKQEIFNNQFCKGIQHKENDAYRTEEYL